MKRLLIGIRDFLDRCDYFLVAIAGIAVLLMMLITSYDVIMRYIFNDPTDWALDVSTFLIPICVFLSLAYVLRKEGHVRVELLLNALKPRVRALLLLITSFISLIVFAIATWMGVKITVESIQRWELSLGTSEILMWPIKLMVPVGFLFLSLQIVSKIFNYVNDIRGKAPQEGLNQTGNGR